MNGLARPEGIAPEIWQLWEQDPPEASRRCDLYALWESLTALAQETRLHARQTRTLAEPVAQELGDMRRALEAVSVRARRDAQADVLGPLLETRERLVRGLESVRRGARLPLLRRPGGAVLEGLKKGYRMALEGLDEALHRLGVEVLNCRGERFDPTTMRAVEVVAGEFAEDRVVEVHRPGYLWNGELYRTAQVKVARAYHQRGE